MTTGEQQAGEEQNLKKAECYVSCVTRWGLSCHHRVPALSPKVRQQLSPRCQEHMMGPSPGHNRGSGAWRPANTGARHERTSQPGPGDKIGIIPGRENRLNMQNYKNRKLNIEDILLSLTVCKDWYKYQIWIEKSGCLQLPFIYLTPRLLFINSYN